jgi:hypothetical protein
MQFAWMSLGSALAVAGLQIVLPGPVAAADQGVRTVAEELGSRTKTQAAPEGEKKGMSDSRVRVMSTYALSILPDEVPGPDGVKVKLDKSNPNIYLIPIDDARRVIRAATRSAYAEACQLYDLEKANFQAMYLTEKARNVWSKEQMMFIQALHTFSTSYFTGNVKITEQPDTPAAAKSESANPLTTTIAPKKLACPPGQKEKVATSINNYVQASGVSLPKDTPAAAAATPAAPAAPAPQAQGAAVPVTGQPMEPMPPMPMAPAPMAPVAGGN